MGDGGIFVDERTCGLVTNSGAFHCLDFDDRHADRSNRSGRRSRNRQRHHPRPA